MRPKERKALSYAVENSFFNGRQAPTKIYDAKYIFENCSQTVIFDLSQPGLPKTKKAEYFEA